MPISQMQNHHMTDISKLSWWPADCLLAVSLRTCEKESASDQKSDHWRSDRLYTCHRWWWLNPKCGRHNVLIHWRVEHTQTTWAAAPVVWRVGHRVDQRECWNHHRWWWLDNCRLTAAQMLLLARRRTATTQLGCQVGTEKTTRTDRAWSAWDVATALRELTDPIASTTQSRATPEPIEFPSNVGVLVFMYFADDAYGHRNSHQHKRNKITGQRYKRKAGTTARDEYQMLWSRRRTLIMCRTPSKTQTDKRNRILRILTLKMTSGSSNLNDFRDNQLTKCRGWSRIFTIPPLPQNFYEASILVPCRMDALADTAENRKNGRVC